MGSIQHQTQALSASYNAWTHVRYFLSLLWTVRVSLFSALLGAFLYASVPQARDLSLEVHARDFNVVDFYYTFSYVLALLFGWLFPVYFSSATLLVRADQDPLASSRLGIVFRRLIPLLLTLACLIGVAVGQYLAWESADLIHDNQVEDWEIPNVVLQLQGTIVIAILFLSFNISHTFFRRRSGLFYLGSALLLLVGAALWTFIVDPAAIAERYHHRYMQDPEYVWSWRALLPLRWIRWYFPTCIGLLWLAARAASAWFGIRPSPRHYERPIALAVSVIATTLFCLLPPLWIAGWLHRAVLLPLLLGAWVPMFSVIGYYSHRLRVPLIFLSLVAFAGLALLREAHTIALKPVDNSSVRQVSLNDALAQWRTANCEGPDRKACPSLKLIAIQGGASRAAYFGATVLGQLIDDGADPGHIFAISGVSGGAFGAATFAAALLDAEKRQGAGRAKHLQPPCRPTSSAKNEASPDISLWYRYPGNHLGYEQEWRSCLQAILAGDYLSPTLIPMAFSDFLGLTALFGMDDRQRVLERAWAERYRDVTGSNTFEEAFSGLIPANAKNWRPLLVMNGASVGAGRRILASHLAPWYCSPKGSLLRLFNDASDIYELTRADTASGCSCQGTQLQCRASSPSDLALSAAVGVSARFPLISPAGKIVNDKGLVDQVVDGGYFENFGISSLSDLIAAIASTAPDLKVDLLLITNDPNISNMDCVTSETDAMPWPASPGWRWDMIAVLSAELATRNSRAVYGAIAACRAAKPPHRFLHVRVVPPDRPPQSGEKAPHEKAPQEFQGISMNWWLSKQVQSYLDRLVPSSCVGTTGSTASGNKQQFCSVLSAQ